LRRRFQRAAGLSDEDLTAAPAAPAQLGSQDAAVEVELPEITAVPASPAPPADPPTARLSPSQLVPAVQDEVHEVDLSDEWASLLEETRPAAPVAKETPAHTADAAPVFELPEEPAAIEEFVIAEEPIAAPSAIVPPEDVPAFAEFEVPAEVAPQEEELNPFAEISAEIPEEVPAEAEALAVPEEISEELIADLPAPELQALEQVAAPEIHASEPELPPIEIPREEPVASKPALEFDVEQEYELVLDPEPLVPAYDQKPPEHPIVPLEPEPEPVAQNAAPAAPAGSGFASDQFLSDLAKEIDQLGIGELTPAFSQPAPPREPVAELKPEGLGESSPLKEVFDDFRAELGEMGAEDEDLETHYNLGIAFREMGLLDEAISEFQKVAKASERGRPFPYTMQCSTFLGLAFIEKGQPGIAAIWYERALLTPNLDPESILALRYDLGMAQESAGEMEAALKSFSQVYAMNIDYRDVAERIAALQKPIR